MILFFRNVALISCLLGIFWGGYGEAPSKCKGSTRLECVDIDHDCTDDIRQCYYCSDTDALCLGLNTSVPLCNPSLCSTGCCNPEGCGSEEECMYSNTMASLLYYFGLGAAFVALVIIGGLFCYYRAFASKDEPPKEAPRVNLSLCHKYRFSFSTRLSIMFRRKPKRQEG